MPGLTPWRTLPNARGAAISSTPTNDATQDPDPKTREEENGTPPRIHHGDSAEDFQKSVI